VLPERLDTMLVSVADKDFVQEDRDEGEGCRRFRCRELCLLGSWWSGFGELDAKS
jgi:hypothetical protein